MKLMLRRVNRTLFELEVGILIFGLLAHIPVFFLSKKGSYTGGLWIGIITAMLCAFHMWWSLDRAFDREEKAAVRFMSTQNVVRYVLIAAILIGLSLSAFANPLAAFVGIMGLKASAYMRFFTVKISNKIYGIEVPYESIPVEGEESDSVALSKETGENPE